MEPGEGPLRLYHPHRHSDRPFWPLRGRVLCAPPSVQGWWALVHRLRSRMTCGSALVKKSQRDKDAQGKGVRHANVASLATKLAKKCQREETKELNLSIVRRCYFWFISPPPRYTQCCLAHPHTCFPGTSLKVSLGLMPSKQLHPLTLPPAGCMCTFRQPCVCETIRLQHCLPIVGVKNSILF